MTVNNKLLTFLALILLLNYSDSYGQFSIDLESGAVFSGYNDVRIPGDQGTLFSLSEELETDPTFFFRIRINYALTDRNILSILYAPLSINSTGQFDKDVFFEGETFPANSDIEGFYKFNSYRLTWRYDLYRSNAIDFGI